VGIDLGVISAHKAVVLNPATGEYLGKPWTFRPFPQELARLLRRARRGCTEAVQIVVVLEATGMAWYPVGTYLHDHGAWVYRVNGRLTRDLRKVLQRYAGSDRIDCRVLAQLYPVARQRLIRWQPPTGEQLALQRACREFARWRSLGVAIQNRLTAYDQWAWNGLTHLIPAEALPWMRHHWYDPWRVHAAGGAALAAAWQASAPEPTNAEIDWIPAWVARAEQMTQLYGTPERVGYADLEAAIARNLALLAQTHQARAILKQRYIQPQYQRMYPQRWLESLYGVGLPSAATYHAFLMDINRFPSAAQFRSWCGIVPHSHQSGSFEAKGLSITQAGPNLIKATLYLNADVARQWDVQFAALYHRQMVEYGKHHTLAVCACASHLATRIYTLLKQQRPYELRDLDNRPISIQDSRQLCLTRYRVSDEIRKRNAVRARRARHEQRTEQRFRHQQPF
jgi:transposase